MNTTKKVEFIKNWIQKYVDSMPVKAKSLVIGISGGIDSSVSSTLCAMTGMKTIVLSMPIKQKSAQHDLSLSHQEWLKKNFSNVEGHTIELDNLFGAFESSLSKFDNEHGMANSRARLRMTTLYYFSAINNYLVAGTGNKVEDFGIGFYTKYGDGGVDISPIADLMKSEVFVLAKYLNIIEDIQNSKPTDGLWDDDRTDEDQIGASYDEIEYVMKNFGKNSNQKFTTRQKEVLQLYKILNSKNKHKMDPIPVCKVPKYLKNSIKF